MAPAISPGPQVVNRSMVVRRTSYEVLVHMYLYYVPRTSYIVPKYVRACARARACVISAHSINHGLGVILCTMYIYVLYLCICTRYYVRGTMYYVRGTRYEVHSTSLSTESLL